MKDIFFIKLLFNFSVTVKYLLKAKLQRGLTSAPKQNPFCRKVLQFYSNQESFYCKVATLEIFDLWNPGFQWNWRGILHFSKDAWQTGVRQSCLQRVGSGTFLSSVESVLWKVLRMFSSLTVGNFCEVLFIWTCKSQTNIAITFTQCSESWIWPDNLEAESSK